MAWHEMRLRSRSGFSSKGLHGIANARLAILMLVLYPVGNRSSLGFFLVRMRSIRSCPPVSTFFWSAGRQNSRQRRKATLTLTRPWIMLQVSQTPLFLLFCTFMSMMISLGRGQKEILFEFVAKIQIWRQFTIWIEMKLACSNCNEGSVILLRLLAHMARRFSFVFDCIILIESELSSYILYINMTLNFCLQSVSYFVSTSQHRFLVQVILYFGHICMYRTLKLRPVFFLATLAEKRHRKKCA
jgi:hypothetical protein